MVAQEQNPKNERMKTGELYDLINDSKELRNIANKEEKLVSDLRQEIGHFIKHNQEIFRKSRQSIKRELKIGKVTRERLKVLGYIQ